MPKYELIVAARDSLLFEVEADDKDEASEAFYRGEAEQLLAERPCRCCGERVQTFDVEVVEIREVKDA